MTWPQARKDAEEFANALDGRRPLDGELRELVRCAERLCESAVEPAEEFLLGLRAQLMAEAATVLVAAPVVTPPDTVRTDTVRTDTAPARRARRRLAAAAVGAITVAGALGITATSAQALPGDMLYPVKRGVETVQLSWHRSDASRGAFELGQATTRLAEAQRLATATDARDQSAVAQSLSDFAGKARAGSRSLFDDFSNGGNRASVNKVAAFAARSNSGLEALTAALPEGSTAAFRAAASTVSALIVQAAALCDECRRTPLSDLASRVQAAVTPAAKPAAGTPAATPSATSTASAGTTTPPPAPTAPRTQTPTTKPPPSAAVTVTPPPVDLGKTTEPLLGALLGDDSRPGLIPGLVGGLLGAR